MSELFNQNDAVLPRMDTDGHGQQAGAERRVGNWRSDRQARGNNCPMPLALILLIPEGWPIIAQRFNVGDASLDGHKSRRDDRNPARCLSRPYGTYRAADAGSKL